MTTHTINVVHRVSVHHVIKTKKNTYSFPLASGKQGGFLLDCEGGHIDLQRDVRFIFVAAVPQPATMGSPWHGNIPDFGAAAKKVFAMSVFLRIFATSKGEALSRRDLDGVTLRP